MEDSAVVVKKEENMRRKRRQRSAVICLDLGPLLIGYGGIIRPFGFFCKSASIRYTEFRHYGREIGCKTAFLFLFTRACFACGLSSVRLLTS